jgi:hypothetical protein
MWFCFAVMPLGQVVGSDQFCYEVSACVEVSFANGGLRKGIVVEVITCNLTFVK